MNSSLLCSLPIPQISWKSTQHFSSSASKQTIMHQTSPLPSCAAGKNRSTQEFGQSPLCSLDGNQQHLHKLTFKQLTYAMQMHMQSDSAHTLILNLSPYGGIQMCRGYYYYCSSLLHTTSWYIHSHYILLTNDSLTKFCTIKICYHPKFLFNGS